MKKQTQAIHTRFQHRDAYNALSMPVYHTAAYEFEDAVSMSDAFCGRTDAPDYSRVMNPTVTFFDFMVDGTDNFAVKFLINDACVMSGKPFSHGGIFRYEEQSFTHLPGTACYRCLFGAPPPAGSVPTCSQAGVLGAIAGMLGTIQAAEVLKYLTGTGQLLTDCLLTFHALTMDFQKISVLRHEGCPVCGVCPSITGLAMACEPTACDLNRHG